jgi:hypothetical protein
MNFIKIRIKSRRAKERVVYTIKRKRKGALLVANRAKGQKGRQKIRKKVEVKKLTFACE